MIYQTLETVFDQISKNFKVRQKYSAVCRIFNISSLSLEYFVFDVSL